MGNRWLMALPPVIFVAIAATFFLGMQRDNPGELPSVFVGKAAPAVPEGQLEGFAGLSDADLRQGEVTIVNFWASWCPPCRAEHPVLLDLQAKGIRVAGVNFKDDTKDATDYLTERGNPFFGLAVVPGMRSPIDWGVTAPPETFIVDGDGTVLFRFTGALLGTDYEARFLPALQKALGK